MLAEANRGATLTIEQRSNMVQQMQTAGFRIAQLESGLILAQSQVSHCADAATHERGLYDEAVAENARL